ALVERADEQGALVAHRHLARLRHALRVHLDLEAGRQLDVGQHLLEIGLRRRQRLTRVRRQALLGLRLVAEEPVGRRIEPEILVVRLVLLETLSLHRQRAAGDERRDRTDKARVYCFLPSHGCLLLMPQETHDLYFSRGVYCWTRRLCLLPNRSSRHSGPAPAMRSCSSMMGWNRLLLGARHSSGAIFSWAQKHDAPLEWRAPSKRVRRSGWRRSRCARRCRGR